MDSDSKGAESLIRKRIQDGFYRSLFEYLEDVLNVATNDDADSTWADQLHRRLEPIVRWYYARHPDLMVLLEDDNEDVIRLYPRLRKRRKDKDRRKQESLAAKRTRRLSISDLDPSLPEDALRAIGFGVGKVAPRQVWMRRSTVDGSTVYSSFRRFPGSSSDVSKPPDLEGDSIPGKHALLEVECVSSSLVIVLGDVSEIQVAPTPVRHTQLVREGGSFPWSDRPGPVHCQGHVSPPTPWRPSILRLKPPVVPCRSRDESPIFINDLGSMNSFAPRFDSSEAKLSHEDAALVLAWHCEGQNGRVRERPVSMAESSSAALQSHVSPAMGTLTAGHYPNPSLVDAAQNESGDLSVDPDDVTEQDDSSASVGPREMEQLLLDAGISLTKDFEKTALAPDTIDEVLDTVSELLFHLCDWQIQRVLLARIPDQTHQSLQSLALPTGVVKQSDVNQSLVALVRPMAIEVKLYHRIESFLYFLIHDLAPSSFFKPDLLELWLSDDSLVGSRLPMYRGSLAWNSSRRLHELTNDVLKKDAPVPVPPKSVAGANPNLEGTPHPPPMDFAKRQQMVPPPHPVQTMTPQIRQMMTDPRAQQAYQAYYQAYYNALRAQQLSSPRTPMQSTVKK